MMMNKTQFMILALKVLVGLLVLVGVIVLVVYLLRRKSGPSGLKPVPIKICVNEDHSKEFMSDLNKIKNANLDNIFNFIGIDKNVLDEELYNKNKMLINNIYCDINKNKIFKSIIQNISTGNGYCLKYLVSYNIIEELIKLINSNEKLITIIPAIYVTIRYDLYKTINKSATKDKKIDELCKILDCDGLNTVWQKGRDEVWNNINRKDLSNFDADKKGLYYVYTYLIQNFRVNPAVPLSAIIKKDASLETKFINQCLGNVKSTPQDRNVVLSLFNAIGKTLANDIISTLIQIWNNNPGLVPVPSPQPPPTIGGKGGLQKLHPKFKQLSGVPAPYNA
jgi:hypothetical protein